MEQIVDAHLFGAAVPSRLVVQEAPETRLQLTLAGVMASNHDLNGRAVIASDAATDRVYAIGDHIDGTDAKLRLIDVDRVVIERGKQLEKLSLDRQYSESSSWSETSTQASSLSPRERALAARKKQKSGKARKQKRRPREDEDVSQAMPEEAVARTVEDKLLRAPVLDPESGVEREVLSTDLTVSQERVEERQGVLREDSMSMGRLEGEATHPAERQAALEREVARLAAIAQQRAAELSTVRTTLARLEQEFVVVQRERAQKAEKLTQLQSANAIGMSSMESAKERITRLEREVRSHRDAVSEAQRLRARVVELENRLRQAEEVAVAATTGEARKLRSGELRERDATATSVTPTQIAKPETTTVTTESDTSGDIRDIVQAWSKAWADQDVTGYLKFYAEDFRPETGMDVDAWKKLRQRRLTRPSFIKIDIAELAVERVGANRARARFRQSYRANHYRDSVIKTLELVRVDDIWSIVRETSRKND